MGRKGKQEKRNSRSQAAQADTQKPAEASATAPDAPVVGSDKVQEYQQKTSKLFISGLPMDATDEELEEIFSNVGPLKKGASFVVKGKGIGFVHYCKRISAIIRVTRVSNRYSILGEDADQAREKLNGTKLRGNTIRVSLAKVRKSMLLAQLPLTRTGKDDRKEGGQTPEKGPTPGKGPAPVRPKKPSAGDQIAVDSSGIAARVVVLSGLEGTYCTIGWVNSNASKYGTVEKIEFPPTQFKKVPEAVEAVKQFNDEGISASIYSVTSIKRFRLIIRNIPFQYSFNDFKEQFSQYGTLYEISLPASKKNPRNHCGYGFVNYTNAADTEKAIREGNKLTIKGRTVAVDYAVPKDIYQKLKVETVPQKTESSVTKMSEEDDESDEEIDGDRGVEDNEDDEEDEDDDDEDSEDTQDKLEAEKESKDIREGRSLFLRNIAFSTTQEEIKTLFSQYGSVKSVKLTTNPDTGELKYASTLYSLVNADRGTGFVEFETPEHATLALEMSYQSKAFKEGQKNKKLDRKQRKDKLRERREEESDLAIGGRNLIITRALSRAEAQRRAEEDKQKKPVDKRNLHLAEVGVIKPDSLEAQALSQKDMQKRLRLWQEKKLKLANPNFHVSNVRLAIGNIPKAVTDAELKQVFQKASNHAKMVQVKIARDLTAKDKEGNAFSRGFGFVEFKTHYDALVALNATNNKPGLFEKFKNSRLIVEFAVENIIKLQQREEKKKALQGRKRKREDTDEDEEARPKKLTRGQRQREKKRQARAELEQAQLKKQQEVGQGTTTTPATNKATTATPKMPQQKQVQPQAEQQTQSKLQEKKEKKRNHRAEQRLRKLEKEREKKEEQAKRREADPFFFTKDDFTPEPESKRPRKSPGRTKKANKPNEFEQLVASYTNVLIRPKKRWDEL